MSRRIKGGTIDRFFVDGRYRIRYRGPDGKRRSDGSFATKQEAEAYRAEQPVGVHPVKDHVIVVCRICHYQVALTYEEFDNGTLTGTFPPGIQPCQHMDVDGDEP